jgi:hypothetical protein
MENHREARDDGALALSSTIIRFCGRFSENFHKSELLLKIRKNSKIHKNHPSHTSIENDPRR